MGRCARLRNVSRAITIEKMTACLLTRKEFQAATSESQPLRKGRIDVAGKASLSPRARRIKEFSRLPRGDAPDIVINDPAAAELYKLNDAPYIRSMIKRPPG